MTEKLNDYLQRWGLSNAESLAQTATSNVYKVIFNGEQAVLKILTPIGVADEQGGAVALNCFDGQGAVKLLRHDEGAHLLEFVGGTDLVSMVHNGNDEQATMIIADVLNQLHTAYQGMPLQGLIPLKKRFQALFAKAEQDKQAGLTSIFVRAAPIAEALLSNPQHETVLHGDIHHENIRYHDKRGWLAFDPKGLYGERTYDAANTVCNPWGIPELVETEARSLRISKILADKMQISHARVLAFVYSYACLSASWSFEDGDSWPRSVLKIAKLVEPHINTTT